MSYICCGHLSAAAVAESLTDLGAGRIFRGGDTEKVCLYFDFIFICVWLAISIVTCN